MILESPCPTNCTELWLKKSDEPLWVIREKYFYFNLYSMNFRILHWVDYFVSDIMTEIIRFPNSKNLLSPELPAVHRQHFQTVISFRYNCSIHHRLCFNGFANQFFSVSQKKNLTQFFHRNCFFLINLVEVRLPTASRWQPFSEFYFKKCWHTFLISHLIVFSSFLDTKRCTWYYYKHVDFKNLFGEW